VPIKQDEQFEQEQIEQEQIEQEQIEQDELLELDEQKVRNHLPEQEQIEQDDKPERSRDAATSPASAYSQIWDLQLAGLKHLLNGEQAQATELMDQAVALEDQLPPPSGPPDLVKPTRELYGELLLFI